MMRPDSAILDTGTAGTESAAGRSQFLRDVLDGLRTQPKRLPCKYLYDERGAELYAEICRLDEYYLTRCELDLLIAHGAGIARAAGPVCTLIEYGSGSVEKLAWLLPDFDGLRVYVPVDISRPLLAQTVADLSTAHGWLKVEPVCTDFTRPFRVPPVAPEPRLVFFPGSTIGNFSPDEAVLLLAGMQRLCGRRGGALVGFDLRKDRRVMKAAYNDRTGVTAAFNRNLLARINRELRGDFDLPQFEHRAVYNEAAGRIEMSLVSRTAQRVQIAGNVIRLSAGESIHTENCYKYTPEGFAKVADRAGLRIAQFWTDERRWFAEALLTPAAEV